MSFPCARENFPSHCGRHAAKGAKKCGSPGWSGPRNQPGRVPGIGVAPASSRHFGPMFTRHWGLSASILLTLQANWDHPMVQGRAKPAIHSPTDGAREARGGLDAAVDLAHLSRMTLGEKQLQGEVLALFDQQAAMLLARMKGAPPKMAAALAHTLAGSARGIGAWEVARAAQEVELAARGSVLAETASAVSVLERMVGRARAAIKELLGGAAG